MTFTRQLVARKQLLKHLGNILATNIHKKTTIGQQIKERLLT
jgi:hypothetical protein